MIISLALVLLDMPLFKGLCPLSLEYVVVAVVLQLLVVLLLTNYN